MRQTNFPSEKIKSYYRLFQEESRRPREEIVDRDLSPEDSAYVIEQVIRLSAKVDHLAEQVEELEKELYRRTLPTVKSDMESLERTPGIGKKRAEALVLVFGSIKEIRQASVDELVSATGIPREVAKRLKSQL